MVYTSVWCFRQFSRFVKKSVVRSGTSGSNYNEKAFTGERPSLCFIARFAHGMYNVTAYTARIPHMHTHTQASVCAIILLCIYIYNCFLPRPIVRYSYIIP